MLKIYTQFLIFLLQCFLKVLSYSLQIFFGQKIKLIKATAKQPLCYRINFLSNFSAKI